MVLVNFRDTPALRDSSCSLELRASSDQNGFFGGGEGGAEGEEASNHGRTANVPGHACMHMAR